MAAKLADHRVRVVLVVGVVLVLGLLVLEMSGSAQRTVGSNRVAVPVFSATVPGGGAICQTASSLPDEAAAVRLLVGTYGRPLPPLGLRITNAAGRTVAVGNLASGGKQGFVTIPLSRPARTDGSVIACLRVGGSSKVAIGGQSAPISAGSELVNGKPEPGVISLLYLHGASQTWWQLLPELSKRFGLGKASFFGTWTLPVLVLILVAVWTAALRLLARELR